jgi:hypothetical protein
LIATHLGVVGRIRHCLAQAMVRTQPLNTICHDVLCWTQEM